jgi:aspartate ammonia-lyase
MTENNGDGFRIERDPLGEKRIPSEALYGVQTARARESFRISRLRIHPLLITAIAEIKKAAATVHLLSGKLPQKTAEAIIEAAGEIIAGELSAEFDLDVFQAGAGTSYNMNVNEVIANRALEIIGARRGDYAAINPNDDVNKAQSTNDVMPTAMRISCIRLARRLKEALDTLADSFDAKAAEFANIEKAGRTHLHDATPVTLGDEFAAWGGNVRRAGEQIRSLEASLAEINLGGTAVGKGDNVYAGYQEMVVEQLAELTQLPLKSATNRMQLTQSLGDFVALSGSLRRLAVELGKIANDLRLLSSGPHTGLDEIELPAVQPGSSIMPGKVNPAIPEMLNMVAFHVIGQDVAIMMCAEAGQLELNVMMPYVAYAILEGLETMTCAIQTFDERCVRVIKAHPEKCREYRERSVGLAALHNEELGFMGAAKLAEKAVETGKTIDELVDAGEAEKQEA